LASALPLGITSDAEVVDIWLRQAIDLVDFVNDIGKAIPPGIKVLDVTAVDLKEGSLQSRLRSAEYVVQLPDKWSADELRYMVADILRRSYISRNRRGKDYDLRALIESLDIDSDERGGMMLRMRLAARPGKTGRPEEVLDEMGLYGKRIHRTVLIFVDNPE
jgi:radical SAM-linked protein